MDKNNERESSPRVDFDNQIGDKVLVTDYDIHRKLNYRTREPYNIIHQMLHPIHRNPSFFWEGGVL